MQLLKTYMEATSSKDEGTQKKSEPKLLTISKKIANELIKEYERILENTDEFQDLNDKERKQVEFSVLDIVKRHGW